MTDEEILSLASTFTLAGYTAADTRREAGQMLLSGRRKWDVPNPATVVPEPPRDPDALRPAFLETLNVAMLPRRQWMLGNALLRGQLSVLVAPAGVGKSTHGIARAIAVASGREITGEAVHEQTRVWIYNVEDDLIELKRRLAAALQHHAIDFDEVRGRIALNSGADEPLILAKLDRHGAVVRQPDVAACIAHIQRERIGLFIVDPFVETHEVNENSNEHIKAVAAMYREIARTTGCAVQLVHHTSKPPQGTSDSHAGNMNTARGASALVGVARVVQTLFAMSAADAQRVGIDEEEAHRFLRLDDAKANQSLISGRARWYRRESVELANGDEVGVLAPHTFPDRAPDITLAGAIRVFTEVARMWEARTPYSGAKNATTNPLWKHLKEAEGVPEKIGKSIVKGWLKNMMLTEERFGDRASAIGLKVLKWPG